MAFFHRCEATCPVPSSTTLFSLENASQFIWSSRHDDAAPARWLEHHPSLAQRPAAPGPPACRVGSSQPCRARPPLRTRAARGVCTGIGGGRLARWPGGGCGALDASSAHVGGWEAARRPDGRGRDAGADRARDTSELVAAAGSPCTRASLGEGGGPPGGTSELATPSVGWLLSSRSAV